MKYFGITLLFVASFFAVSCEDERPEQPIDNQYVVDIKTQLFNNGNPIEVGDTVLFSDGTIFNIKLFKLYLSNLKLINENDEEIMLQDIALLDVGDENTGTFQAKIEPGNYKALKLGFGVDPVQNASDPTTFPDEHPLSSYNQMYWSMLKYRFAILEGRSNSTGIFDMQNDVLNAYHTGTDPLYTLKTFTLDNQIFDSGAQVLLNIDLEKIFFSNPVINLKTEASTHSEASDIQIAQKFMSNLAESTIVEVVPPPVSL